MIWSTSDLVLRSYAVDSSMIFFQNGGDLIN